SASGGDGVAARAVAWLARGEARAEPPCPHFGECGGCALQHVAPDFYAAWKRALIETALRRRGVDAGRIAPIVTVAPGSRRRADSGAGGRTAVALRRGRARTSRGAVDAAECAVGPPAGAALPAPARMRPLDLRRPADKASVASALADSGIDATLETA